MILFFFLVFEQYWEHHHIILIKMFINIGKLDFKKLGLSSLIKVKYINN